MASSSCWKCLLRPSMGAASPSPLSTTTTTTTTTTRLLLPTTSYAMSLPTTPSHYFSTTAPQLAGPLGRHQRTGKRMKLSKFKKNKVITRSRIAPGQRKAFRKKITLSNNNALIVHGLEQMSAKNLSSPKSVGKVMKIPGGALDQLRAVEAFKPTQSWGLFHSPHMLVRPETVKLCKTMVEKGKAGETARIVVSGDRAAGKSMLVLQAMTNAFLNKWIVINIPEAQELTTACTEYAPVPDSDPQVWFQPIYALKLMANIRAANKSLLENLYTSRSYETLTNPVAEGANLVALIDSAREADHAWPVFSAFWHELFVVKEDGTGKARPPVLFALDGLSSIMRVSDYRATNFDPIHSHDMVLVREFVNMLAGKTLLPNGGAVIGATSRNNAARNQSMELAINRQLERQAGVPEEKITPRDPYCRKYDERTDQILEGTGLEVIDVRGISKAEARSLMEYWAASGLLRAQVDETTVSEKWMTGGNGIIGEMERAGLLSLRL